MKIKSRQNEENILYCENLEVVKEINKEKYAVAYRDSTMKYSPVLVKVSEWKQVK